MRIAPMVLQEANVFINGKGYLGVTKKFKIPTLEQEVTQAKGALTTEYSAGVFKPMEVEIPLSVVDFNLYAGFGLNNLTNKIPLLIKGSIHQSGKEKQELALAITGDFKSIEHGDYEAGAEFETTLKASVHFMSLTIDGKPLIVYDVDNMICIVGGVDYMSKVRSILEE
ncbi:phage tail tube protein FII [Campylobacter blaseri]|uniref:Phage tail protein n=1 Tax=Campylobacter blaseri TaxID=2042961 RepID=A0A2P8QYQ6_9BACT|nr:phage major tail tube protein [Campylobacter blaseri]PSM51370.1 phage tail protein [Campylobacter blaseri]PSM52820.1 phage tail protein [Campylobacter blaseri]QKF86121.1 phage tail tube protein FII [Campylobacter blaseri]